MCKNVSTQVGNLMAAIEPTLVNLLTILGVANTTEGQAAIAAYNAALQAVQNWKPGTSAQDAVQLVNAFTTAFDAVVKLVPAIPPEVTALVNTISAGIVVVITLLSANSPAPAAAPADATPEEVEAAQTFHAHAVAAQGESDVEKLTSYKPSMWDKARALAGNEHVAADKYKSVWNENVDAAAAVDPKYASLKAA